MTSPVSLLERAVELDRAGSPYAMATVVAVRRPTSARPGRARPHPSGRLDRRVRRRQLRPADRRPGGAPRARRRPAAPAPDQQGGTVREPPRRRHRRRGHDLPLRWHPGDLRGTAPARPGPVGRRHDPDRRRPRRARRRDGLRRHGDRSGRRPERPAGGSRVVVGDDLAALAEPDRRARTSSSPARASGTRRRSPRPSGSTSPTSGSSPARPGPRPSGPGCSTRAIEPDRVLAMRAPAGIDLGAETAAEVAVSILAELVQVRRGRASFVAAPGPATLAGGGASAATIAADGPGGRRHRPARPGLRDDRRPGKRSATSRNMAGSSTRSARSAVGRASSGSRRPTSAPASRPAADRPSPEDRCTSKAPSRSPRPATRSGRS